MLQKIYITNSNQATFICPKCEKTKTVDVTKYAQMDQTVKVKSKCTCGHTWISVLEKRKQYRKGVDLVGVYIYIVNGKEVDRGNMTIIDLSAGGVKLRLKVARDFNLGDLLKIEFRLDDNKNTQMTKTVVIRNISGEYIGAAFRDTDPYDPVLGFYLMS